MENKMKPEIKERWLNALRSGEYPQTQARLHRSKESADANGIPAGFCCLGVLCEVATQDHIVRAIDTKVGRIYRPTDPNFDDDEAVFGLNEVVMQWAGLADPNPIVPSMLGVRVADLNDGPDGLGTGALSFAQIADLIEKDF